MEYTSKKAIIAAKYRIMSIIMTKARRTKVPKNIQKKIAITEKSNQADKVLNQRKKTVVYSVSIANNSDFIDLPFIF